jgi:hypothetical protein
VVALVEAARLTPDERYRRTVDRLVRQRDRLTDQQARDMARLLTSLRRDVIAELAQLASGDSYSTFQLGQLQGAIERAAGTLVRRMGPMMGGALDLAWAAGDAITPTALDAAGIDLRLRDIDLTQLAVAKSLAGQMISRVGADFMAQANRAVVMGVAGRTSPYRVMQDVSRLLATQPDRQTGRLGSIAYQAERIQRNEMLATFQIADRARTASLAEDVPDLKKWWDSADDARVRPSHAAAGRRYSKENAIPLDQDFVVGGHNCDGPHDPRLPASETVMCRCIRRVWHPDWEAAEPETEPVAAPLTPTDEVEANVDALAAKVTTMVQSQAALGAKIDTLMSDYARYSAQAQALPFGDERSKLNRKATDALVKAEELRHKYTAAHIKSAEKMRSLFHAPTPSKMRTIWSKAADKTPEWTKGETWFKRVIGDALGYSDIVRIYRDRAAAGLAREASYYLSNTVNMRSGAGGDVMAHELGHFLEDKNRELLRRSREFVARRTAGEAAQRLSDLYPGSGYDLDEMARPDKFIHPYIGKDYGDDGSEVMSMGLQYLYENAAKFLRDDPDMFRHVVRELLRARGGR